MLMQGLRFTAQGYSGEVLKVVERHVDLTEFWWCRSTYGGREALMGLYPDAFILENRLPNRRYEFKDVQLTYLSGVLAGCTVSRKMWNGHYADRHYSTPRRIAAIQSFIKDRTPDQDITAGDVRIVVYDRI